MVVMEEGGIYGIDVKISSQFTYKKLKVRYNVLVNFTT